MDEVAVDILYHAMLDIMARQDAILLVLICLCVFMGVIAGILLIRFLLEKMV